MKKILAILLIAFNLLFQNQDVLAETKPGRPFMTKFNSSEYRANGAAETNWAIVQDDRGVMYFGNGSGVLEYDGANWNLIRLPNRSTVRSLVNANGTIYVGAVGEFGYLALDSLGRANFVSLLSEMPEDKRTFTDVWMANVIDNSVYFQTNLMIISWTPEKNDPGKGKFKIWPAPVENQFHLGTVINGALYVRQWGVGLQRLENDSLVLVPNGEMFADERIYVLLPYDENRIFVGTRSMGFYLYDGNHFEPFKTEADEYFRKHNLYLPGAIIEGGNYALSSNTGGLVVIDRAGKLQYILDNDSDPDMKSLLFSYTDPSGSGLWVSAFSNIIYIETPSPLSIYDELSGLEVPIALDIIRHKGILYVATNVGAYWFEEDAGKFHLLPNTYDQCFDLFEHDGDLFVTVLSQGLLKIEGKNTVHVRRSVNYDFRANGINGWSKDPDIMIVTLDDAIALMEKKKNRWQDTAIRKISFSPNIGTEDNQANIWFGAGDGCVRFHLDKVKKITPELFMAAQLEPFDQENGLPVGGVLPYNVNKKMYFMAADGIYTFDAQTNRFNPDTTFSGIQSTIYSGSGFFMTADEQNKVWLNLGVESAVATPKADGVYSIEKTPFLRFKDAPASIIYPDINGVVWFSCSDMLIRYDPSIKKQYSRPYPARIYRVVIGEDSLISEGSRLSYRNNSIRFSYSATTYDNPGETRFQTQLVGFDSRYSNWTDKKEREYTNLPFGEYTFRVQAKNVYNQLSEEASFSFEILAPWYRTWWAYGFYLLILGLVVFVGDRVQRHRVVKRERERSKLREAQLRVKTAEAEAKALQSENERKKNVELLSEIGKEITASLDMDTIFFKLYEHVNQLADATIFGVGIYHAEKEEIEYRLAIEKGRKYEPYSRDTRDKNQFPVWCIENRKPVFINDVQKEFTNYLKEYSTESDAGRKLEDGEVSGAPLSMIYLPLITKERVIGVITIQSYEKDAYTKYHLNLLQNLATYTTIAFDNAEAYTKLNATLENLKATQEKLVTQEKLASLGALTAGIAHEIKNPLNFVNNFAELSQELVDELREEIDKRKSEIENREEIEGILNDLQQNAKKINEHGKRADSIVRSMLQHSRGKKGERQPTDLNAMLEEDINLAYHGLRAQDSGFNSAIEKDFDKNLGKIEVVPQDISRVFLNVITNGFYAAHQKQTNFTKPSRFSKVNEPDFSPTLSVSTKTTNGKVEIRIRDNGGGIPADIRQKIFQPFFTTKPTGQGTGLGLSISYDIVVQEHNGEIRVDSKEGEFTEFVITLPR